MDHMNLITFTRAKDKTDTWENGERRKSPSPGPGIEVLTGDEVKKFYESLLASDDEAGTSSVRKHKVVWQKSKTERTNGEQNPRSLPTAAMERNGHLLLKCAQDGDLKTLRRLLETATCDINFRDSYYWTATMCAAYSGQAEVVNYLLNRGAAWIGVCDSMGRDALDLARQAGHVEIITMLEEFHPHREKQQEPRERPRQKKYCQICEVQYEEDSIEQHERSTLHLFNKKDKPVPTYYFIPETNVGFRMMLKEGWDRETGLGPTGKGQKFPVKTVLKRDQKGLGFQSDLKPKVTHFNANDSDAVKQPKPPNSRVQRAATVSRREERRQQAKEKAWEKDLRTYMNL
ncbi:G patch domain and ankyrin repeat-containing protein 1 [Rhincodon typus]|uniref:G patch domain and ankyrin repeat-containing protein 1 n=1 Tax=Rhincodon typus TaxID=259920 RepID=UPI0009A25C4C|nr:G patch domain and ankyrin repeat-containing protein 1 [Rhincodon typus]XP_048472895.1 G patch domain and ankyrin repeat-containing protein 1 [Rhincodon typus]XP_048472896.1 G patch domain and ankyrin repeat-containing protein 1 [Rhincodon typus]XP_048472897.1 G patch domain and ankyrin repeat-containing protein 1 [Rhincodon typus]